MNAVVQNPAGSVAPKRPETFPAMIDQLKKQVALALPKHLNADRMARIALTEFRKNPALAKCNPTTVFASVIIAAQVGLEPGVMGQGYLIPYKDTCQFVPGWQGLVDLAQRSGRSSVWTGAVFAGDEFEWEFGTSPYIKHKPCGENDPAKLLYTYAVGRVKGAEFPIIEVWPMARVWSHRDRFNKVGTRHYSYAHPEMYARKVPLLQVLKYLPKSAELALAVELENAAETSGQRLDISDAIDGTFSCAPDQTEEAAASGAGATEALRSKLMPETEDPAIPHFDAASGLEALKNSTTLRMLDETWKAISKDFKASGREVPIDLEAACNDRREALLETEGRQSDL